MAKAKFKPISFSTTMRNPNRISSFLSCISPFEGKILTNEIIFDILKDIMRKKLYKPNIIKNVAELKQVYESDIDTFSDEQLDYIMINTIQNHKEAGFDIGWASRFDTFYKLSMEFGFLQYAMNIPIIITKLGHMLVDAFNKEPIDEQMIQNIFLNALVKYPANNPYRKILNDNVPLIFLLKILKGIQKNYPKGSGIHRSELSFLICWKNYDVEAIIDYIQEFRKKYTFGQYTDEIIYERCLEILGATNKQASYYKMDKITGEAIDEYIRKMRSTGIISLRGNGRFIDLNALEDKKINYILSNYTEHKSFSSMEDYMEYMGEIDENIVVISSEDIKYVSNSIKSNALHKYAKYYTKDDIFLELKKVCTKKPSVDSLFKLIDAPTRLEFLASIALVQNFPNVKVYPNYVVDDEGLPIRHASAGKADIVCLDEVYEGLVEVTLMLGRQQTNNEILPIARHLKSELEERENVVSIFVAPYIFDDAKRMARWLKFDENIEIKTYSISEFIEVLINNNSLDDIV